MASLGRILLAMSKRHPEFLAPIAPTANKYSRGVVGVLAGSDRYPGAAVLAVGGARRGGAGYVKHFSDSQRATDLVLARFPDVVPISKRDDLTADAWLIGSGMPNLKTLPTSPFVVLDSSAMSLARSHRFQDHHAIVITPHEGEAADLGFPIADPSDRMPVAMSMARALNVFVILKGPSTVIASPQGIHAVDSNGVPELSTAGTGDVLAGLTASMLASWQPQAAGEIIDVLGYAVAAHGIAAQIARERVNPVTALDLLEALPEVFLSTKISNRK